MLPRASDLSPSLLRFLSANFASEDDLLRSGALASDLRSGCADLEASLADLSRRLSGSVASYASYSDHVGAALGGVRDGLRDLGLRVSRPDSGKFGDLVGILSIFWGFFGLIFVAGFGDVDGLGRSEQILAEELPALAKEVARVETVRAYAGKFNFLIIIEF